MNTIDIQAVFSQSSTLPIEGQELVNLSEEQVSAFKSALDESTKLAVQEAGNDSKAFGKISSRDESGETLEGSVVLQDVTLTDMEEMEETEHMATEEESQDVEEEEEFSEEAYHQFSHYYSSAKSMFQPNLDVTHDVVLPTTDDVPEREGFLIDSEELINHVKHTHADWEQIPEAEKEVLIEALDNELALGKPFKERPSSLFTDSKKQVTFGTEEEADEHKSRSLQSTPFEIEQDSVENLMEQAKEDSISVEGFNLISLDTEEVEENSSLFSEQSTNEIPLEDDLKVETVRESISSIDHISSAMNQLSNSEEIPLTFNEGRVTLPEAINEIQELVTEIIQEPIGSQSIRTSLQLTPETLGEVEIQLDWKGNEFVGRIMVASEDTKTWLEGQLRSLSQGIQSQRFVSLDKVDVQVTPTPQQEDAAFQFSHQQGQQSQQREGQKQVSQFSLRKRGKTAYPSEINVQNEKQQTVKDSSKGISLLI